MAGRLVVVVVAGKLGLSSPGDSASERLLPVVDHW